MHFTLLISKQKFDETLSQKQNIKLYRCYGPVSLHTSETAYEL